MNEPEHTATAQALESQPSAPNAQPLSPGIWRLDAGRSTAAFAARGVWGAVLVKGRFTGLSGSAEVGADGGFTGELVIAAETLSTGLGFRDGHLKSRQFLHVRRHAEIRFVARRLAAADDGHVLEGQLQVRGRSVELQLPVEIVQLGGERVQMKAETSLDRAALGVGHSPLGMIRGPVRVQAHIVLERQT